jgi:hypothetical protein
MQGFDLFITMSIYIFIVLFGYMQTHTNDYYSCMTSLLFTAEFIHIVLVSQFLFRFDALMIWYAMFLIIHHAIITRHRIPDDYDLIYPNFSRKNLFTHETWTVASLTAAAVWFCATHL